MRPNSRTNVAKPALLIYTFARREALSDEGRTYLRSFWDACHALGMTAPGQELECPTEFPSDFGQPQPSFQILAACIDPERSQKGAYYQAFMFGHDDTVGIVVCLAPNKPNDTLQRWKALHSEWRDKVDYRSLPEGVLGEAYVFHALANRAAERLPQLGETVFQSLPGDLPRTVTVPTPYLTAQGFCLWEAPAYKQRRVFAMLCPPKQEKAATTWLLWQGTEQLAPFIRCLLHAAKIHYEDHVYMRDMPKLKALRNQTEHALDRLLEQHERFTADDHLSLKEIIDAQDDLSRVQMDATGLFMSLTYLRELRTTSEIAARNLRALLPPAHPNAPAPNGSPFHADLARAEWLQQQAGYDLSYLEAVRERAQEAHQLTQLRIEQAMQRANIRQNDLSLLQTTLLSALLTALGTIEAFSLQLPVPKPLQMPLAALLASFALTLPPLLMRWHEPYQRIDYLFTALLGASACWLAATWYALSAPWRLLVACLGALIAPLMLLGLNYWQTRRRQRQRTPHPDKGLPQTQQRSAPAPTNAATRRR